jgi:hypothetical protein
MATAQAARWPHASPRLAAFIVILCASVGAVALSATRAAASAVAPSPVLTPWLSSESYPNGPRFDPRLDASVVLWRAGLSLEEVFAGVLEQTGVEVAFWPPGDENERLRVTLFLNASDPPTLREIMAQLAWVTDCSFATEETGNREAPYRYYLLSTSVGDTAPARLEGDREAALATLREAWEERAPRREEVADRLDEYIAALDLSMEELFTRYEGVDDHLLAAMVDPPRRASVEFLASLDDGSRDSLLDNGVLPYTWEELTGDQQGALQSCLRAPMFGFGQRGRREQDGRERSWTGADVAQVQVFGLSYGSPMIAAQLNPSDMETRGRRPRFLVSPMLDLVGGRDLAPDEITALRRARGEQVSSENERSLFREWNEARRGEMRSQRQERTRRQAEERFAEELGLSAAVEDTLSSLRLPVEDDTSYALWQIQEAVALATGLQVVSDCFYQPARSLRAEADSLYPGEDISMTGLLALRLSAISTEDARGLRWMLADDHRAGWEWRDAGSFLRFRSRARDLWRAALLQPAALAYLDSWLEPHVARAVGADGAAAKANVVLDAQWTSALAAGLTDLQFAQGGKLICGDPRDKETAYRQTLREAILGALYAASDTLRALASLSESQWEQLRDAGLRVAHDLTPDQKEAFNLEPRVGEVVAGAGRGPGGRGRRGPRLGPGGRRGARPGTGGPGGFGPGGLRLEDDREMARLVMKLRAESPYPPRADRRPESGEEGGEQGERFGGRRWGRGPVEENDWLGFWVGDELRGARRLPRRLSVPLAPPGPLPLLVPGSADGD